MFRQLAFTFRFTMTQLDPRRKPRQSRSRATVDAILQATAQVLVRDGYQKTTTNRIATRAGVSVGTLYQYFPNKDALVVALCEQHSQEMMTLLSASIAELQDATPERATKVIVRAMLQAHAVNPKLHEAIISNLPKEKQFEQILAVNAQAEAMVRGFLETHRDRLATDNIDMAAFIVVNTVEALSHAAVFERPDFLGTEELVEEISRLICRYLLK
jgi:AcrR family transcriptional regulator